MFGDRIFDRGRKSIVDLPVDEQIRFQGFQFFGQCFVGNTLHFTGNLLETQRPFDRANNISNFQRPSKASNASLMARIDLGQLPSVNIVVLFI